MEGRHGSLRMIAEMGVWRRRAPAGTDVFSGMAGDSGSIHTHVRSLIGCYGMSLTIFLPRHAGLHTTALPPFLP